MIFLSFSFFLLVFVVIGLLSLAKSKKTSSDYLLASHQEKPWMIALAAVATNNSGYMFIGMIGYAYTNGVSAFWIAIMALLGDFCASLFVYKKIRIASGKIHALTFAETLSKWSGEEHKLVRTLSAVIIVIFLSIYAGAQLKAGGKAMTAIFGFDAVIGSLIGGFVVMLYCALGGIRASIWTNTAQSFVMIFSMSLLFFAALINIGGFTEFVAQVQKVSPEYSSFFPKNLLINQGFGLAFFLIGWFFGGFGIIGQPHIMTSFMAMSKPENISKIRLYYYSWYILFFLFTVAVGLGARILIPFSSGFDAELALPTLAVKILPDVFIGIILAGLFSATMSTADSQILCCAAAISNDILHKKNKSYFLVKIITIIITIFATLIAIIDNQSVFSLVMIGWLALTCSFAQIVFVYAIGDKISQKLALTMMFFGFVSMMIWRHFNLGSAVYEALPGMIGGLLPYLVVKIGKRFYTS